MDNYALTVFNGHLYSGGESPYSGGTIQKWNENGELVQEWETAHNCVMTLTLFNKHLYSGGYDGSNKIQKWTENGELVQEWETAHDVTTLTVFNGHLYSAGEYDHFVPIIKKWTENGQLVQQWEPKHNVEDFDIVQTLIVLNGYLYSGGGGRYLSCTENVTGGNKIQKWTENGELVQEWETAHNCVMTLTVFNEHLYSGGYDGRIKKWTENGELEQEWKTAHWFVNTLTVFNGHIYSCGGGIKIQKWTENGELFQEYKHTDDDRNVTTLTFFNGHLYSVVDKKIQKWKKRDMNLFFQIFYKGTVYNYNLEGGILEKIASYMPMFYR